MKLRDLIRILWAVLYFTDHQLIPFKKLLCKIANPQDIDLKFSGIIADVKIIILQIVKLACPEIVFSENRLFERFWTLRTYNLQTR